jgi:hypothetical protein
MAGIQFEHCEDSLELLNPLKGFAPERQRIEVYRDPLPPGRLQLQEARFLPELRCPAHGRERRAAGR